MINYADYDYWDYGYAENDIKSFQFGDASINGVATVSSIAIRNRLSAAQINCTASVQAFATLPQNIFASAQIDCAGSVQANAIRAKNGLCNIQATGTVQVSATRYRLVTPEINATANVVAKSKLTLSIKGSINTAASVSCKAKILGEEWITVVPEANIWIEQI